MYYNSAKNKMKITMIFVYRAYLKFVSKSTEWNAFARHTN